MLKWLVIAAVFVGIVTNIQRRDFGEKCKSVSGAVGVDAYFESLYDAYNECAIEVGDFVQFSHDLMEVLTNIWMVRSGSILHLSDNQKTGLIAFLQTYCPKVIAYMKCDDVVAPIYEKCYTIAERNATTVGKASWLRLIANICGNNVDHLVHIVHAKGLECGVSRGISCFRDYGIPHDPFSNPRLESFCLFRNMITNCLGTVFKECELTQALMKSFFTNIESETLCDNLHDQNENDENVTNGPRDCFNL